MKKLFLMGFVALGLASCVSDKEVVPQTQDQKYAAAFENFVGGKVNPNVNWGFDDMEVNSIKETSAMRSHNVNGNQWGTDDLAIQVPNNVTTEEEALVLAYFEALPKDIVNSVNVNWSDFYVYQVHKGTDIVKDANNADVYASSQMNYLWCYKQPNMTDGEDINNFNNGDNQTTSVTESRSVRPNYTIKGGTFMYNSGTADFSYYNSTDSKYHNEYIIIPGSEIHPSLAGYYYVGFDFWGYKSEYQHANNNMDVHRDYTYTDWIVRISPAEYIHTQRIMVEDLIDTNLDKIDISDWDFNDAVFDAAFVKDYTANKEYAVITLWAAGGTKNLTVGGKEVHELFGQPVSKMINTNANGGVDGLAPVVFRVSLGDIDYSTTRNALDIVTKVGSTELTAKQGDATQKFAVPVGTKWMKERKIITDSYTSFKGYVKNDSPKDWYNTVENAGLLY